MKDLLRTSHLAAADLARLLDLAAAYRAEPHRDAALLTAETVGLYFAKPSTADAPLVRDGVAARGAALSRSPRRNCSSAEARPSRTPPASSVVTPAPSSSARLPTRTSAASPSASIPVVNALTDAHHPCQALADLLTLREHFGSFENLKVAYVGDGNNVAHSLLEACALAGIDIAVATPAGYGRGQRSSQREALALDRWCQSR